MIPNLLNTLVGLGLAYVAIFPETVGAEREPLILAAALATVVLAAWARRSAVLPWQATATLVAGLLLAFVFAVAQIMPVSGVLMFWCVLWAGLTAAILSLWAALYRPTRSTLPAE